MSRLTLPGILLTFAVLLVSGFCVGLGFWQLDRLAQRRVVNAALVTAANLPPLDLDSTGFAAIMRDPEAHLYRRATARGYFVSEGEVLLRGRSHDGRPGVHLVAPLQAGEGLILVNRGWLPSPDAATVDPRPFRLVGPQLLTGSLQAVPVRAPDAAYLRIDLGDTTVATYRRLDYEMLAATFEAPLPRLYLQLLPDSTGDNRPVPVPLPELDEGPHLGYAIQWFSFAAIAFFGFLFVAFFRKRPLDPVAVSGRQVERN